MNITTSTGFSLKSSRAKVFPSTDSRRKSGHGVPSGRSRLSVAMPTELAPCAAQGKVVGGGWVNVIVDLPAVRPGRLADGVAAADLAEHVREFRAVLRDARAEPLPAGVRLVLSMDVRGIAGLADLVRAEADALPFFGFRVLADPPACWLEVTGTGRAAEVARTVFGELGA